jgi:hypothetical protein
MSEIIRVKHTYLSRVKFGDRLVYRWKGLIPHLDFLGFIEVVGQGNTGTDRDPAAPGFSKGDATHMAIVTQLPDPEAEVELIRVDEFGREIFKVKDSTTFIVEEHRTSKWQDEIDTIKRKTSAAGIKFEATWPRCQQWVIDWENEFMEVWRPRRAVPEDFIAERALFDIDLGPDPERTAKQYDLAEFVTFGNVRLANAKICSEAASVRLCEASTVVNALADLKRAPIVLTPDLKGILDPFITPNDNINSGELYRVTFQGLLPDGEREG